MLKTVLTRLITPAPCCVKREMSKLTTPLVRECIAALDSSHGDSPHVVNGVIKRLTDAGAVPGIHVGKEKSTFTQEEILEWYAGQIVSTLSDEKKWHAVNAIINCVDKFAPVPVITEAA